MRLFAVLPIASLLCASNALPTSSVVLEKIGESPTGWTLDPSAKTDKDATTLTLKIHLVNQRMNEFHKLALDVSQSFFQEVECSAHSTNRLRHQVLHSTATILITNKLQR